VYARRAEGARRIFRLHSGATRRKVPDGGPGRPGYVAGARQRAGSGAADGLPTRLAPGSGLF